MHEPIINKDLLSVLQLVHGAYNVAVFGLFLYQAALGLRIRRARKAGAPLPFPAIKRHRKNGPVFAGMALFGFFFGLGLVMVDTGRLLEYPVHFAIGLLLMVFMATTVAVSRGIKGQDSAYRAPHFVIGLALLVLFVVQILAGVAVLL